MISSGASDQVLDYSLVIFLSCGIPKCQFDLLSIHFDIGDVVFENGRNVDL